MTQTQSATRPTIAELHAQFLAILPIIERNARIAHRDLTNYHDQEDAVADTVAMAWEQFRFLMDQDAHQVIPQACLTQLIGLLLNTAGTVRSPR
jgi:hypothetical protein